MKFLGSLLLAVLCISSSLVVVAGTTPWIGEIPKPFTFSIIAEQISVKPIGFDLTGL